MIQKLLLFLLLIANSIIAQAQHLILIGGGKRTPDVLTRFIALSGSEGGKILVIPWASGEQAQSFEGIKKDIDSLSKIEVVLAPLAPLDAAKKAILINQLKTAKGIFFTGGDQNRIMEVLKDEELFQLVQEKYKQGVVVGGTSAGTAIMSKIMITGKGDLEVIDGSKIETSKGLGLVDNIIVDQHFIKRQRENRLIGVIFLHPNLLGVGIDENTAVVIEENRFIEVMGNSQVIVFETLKKPNEMKFTMLKKGDKFDLREKKQID